jgi:hypothetical protein
MPKPNIHAELSVKRHKGKIEDYLKIHEWFDQTKAHFPDMRHRAILHSSFGIFLAAQVFGEYITNSDGKTVSVRDIGEEHIAQDMGGFIPTIQDYLQEMEVKDWMMGKGHPPSSQKIQNKKKTTTEQLFEPPQQVIEFGKIPTIDRTFLDGSRVAIEGNLAKTPEEIRAEQDLINELNKPLNETFRDGNLGGFGGIENRLID